MSITLRDIRKLAEAPSPMTRADLAGRIAASLSRGVFDAREGAVALDIIRLLVRDVAMQVRKAIAHHLSDSLTVPRDIVLALANDEAEVAQPLLRYSYVLSEEDLIEIVRSTREVTKLVAIAQRDTVSRELSSVLLSVRVEEATQALFVNPGAQFTDNELLEHWEHIASRAALLDILVKRGGLSLALAEKLYVAVSDEVKPVLARMYRLPVTLIEEAGDDAHEWTLLGLRETEDEAADSLPGEHELERLVSHLHLGNRLTYSLVIRALCVGDIAFFEVALAKLAGISRLNARLLLFDQGKLGFKAIYEKARMPEGFYAAIATLLRISLEETEYGRFKYDDFRKRVIARVQAARYDRSIENMPYLLKIIGGPHAAAHAKP